MEWMNRSARPAAPASQTPSAGGAAPAQHSNKNQGFSPMRLASVVMLFAGALLLVVLALFLAVGGKDAKGQDEYVDSKDMQAVFLNGGQVYFGNINSLNDQYLSMSNIYYLRVNQQVQPNGQSSNNQDISLVKLGCELHGPKDRMVINQNQVIFWENLKADGQVAKAVAEYKKQNPNGQQCNTNTSTNNNSSTTNNNSNSSNTTNKNNNSNNSGN